MKPYYQDELQRSRVKTRGGISVTACIGWTASVLQRSRVKTRGGIKQAAAKTGRPRLLQRSRVKTRGGMHRVSWWRMRFACFNGAA